MDNGYCSCKKIFTGSLPAEAGGEYVLPDYLPDVRRVLHVTANPRQTGKFIEPGTVNAEGVVDFGIVFAAEDGTLHSVSYTATFSVKAAVRDMSGDCTICAFVNVPDTGVRLSNPRKFAIRAHVSVSLDVFCTERVEPYIDGVQDGNLEYKSQTITGCTVFGLQCNAMTASEDISIPETQPEPESIISFMISPRTVSTAFSNGQLRWRGEANGQIIYKNANDASYSAYSFTLPLSYIFEDERIKENSRCLPEVYIYDAAAETAPDARGEKRVLEIDFLYDVFICCNTESELICTTDIYSTVFECTPVYRDVMCRRASEAICTHTSQSAKSPLSVLGASPERIVFASASCESAECVYSENEIICEGSVGICCIVLRAGEYENVCFSSPFRAVIPAQKLEGEVDIDCVCAVSSPSVRFDGEGVYADYELFICAVMSVTSPVKLLGTLKIEDTRVLSPDAFITVCRPAHGESLWDIAKRYRVSYEALKAANTESSDVIRIV